jgi:hypothetical protein
MHVNSRLLLVRLVQRSFDNSVEGTWNFLVDSERSSGKRIFISLTSTSPAANESYQQSTWTIIIMIMTGHGKTVHAIGKYCMASCNVNIDIDVTYGWIFEIIKESSMKC